MQTMRLETKDGVLVAEVPLPANGEPDAIAYGDRIFVRRLMRVTQPPTKNSPEVYFEATTHHMDGPIPETPNPKAHPESFDKVTGPTITTKQALAPK